MQDYLPILLQVAIVLGFGITTLLISVLLGKSAKRTPVKDMAYECGMVPQGEAQPRFSVKFYLVAMLFILFDIEVVFLYPVGVILKGADSFFVLGELITFVVLLLVAFVYVWRKGALNWK